VFAATLTAVVCAILQNCRGDDAPVFREGQGGQWLSKQPLDFLHALGFWRTPRHGERSAEAAVKDRRDRVGGRPDALDHSGLAITTVYGITSLPRDQAHAARLLELHRQHWTIENSVFYVR
jgi:hypothetical protein